MVLFPTAVLMSSISSKRATILSSMLVGLSLRITPVLGGDCDVPLPEEFNELFIDALDDLEERIETVVMGGFDEFGLGPLGTSLKPTDIFDLKTDVSEVLFDGFLFGDDSSAREELISTTQNLDTSTAKSTWGDLFLRIDKLSASSTARATDLSLELFPGITLSGKKPIFVWQNFFEIVHLHTLHIHMISLVFLTQMDHLNSRSGLDFLIHSSLRSMLMEVLRVGSILLPPSPGS